MQTLMFSSSISFEVNSLGNNFCRSFLVEEVNWQCRWVVYSFQSFLFVSVLKSAAFIAASCFLVKLSRNDNKRVSEKDKCLPCFAVSSISLTASRNSFLEVKVIWPTVKDTALSLTRACLPWVRRKYWLAFHQTSTSSGSYAYCPTMLFHFRRHFKIHWNYVFFSP